MKRAELARMLFAVTISLTIGEFVELQKLSPEDLRSRFGLQPNCDPAVTASTTDPGASRMTVAIECRAKPPATPPPAAPKSRPDAPRSGARDGRPAS